MRSALTVREPSKSEKKRQTRRVLRQDFKS